ncbi:MAG: hypothetical protein P8010_03245, partial [Desulfosarcinaceae bacterium]
AKQIPLAGRIVALADVFDALTSERPYKKAFSIEKANRIIEQGRGHHFDPVVVAAFFAIQDEILDLKERYQDEKQSRMFCLDHMAKDWTNQTTSECTPG